MVDDKFLEALRNIQKKLEKLSDNWPYGLHLYRAFLLVILMEKCSKQKPLNLTSFAIYFSVSAATMTRYAKKFKENGWVLREKRGRETLLFPTEKALNFAYLYIESVVKEFSVKN
jgi:DNA-binding MarR family transcriptional regulator